MVKNLPMQDTWVLSLSSEDPLEKEMATHFSILAWEILWIEEPGGRQFMGSQRVGHGRAHMCAQESNILDDYWTENVCIFRTYSRNAFTI